MYPSIRIGATNPLTAKRKESLSNTDSARYKGFLVEYSETGVEGLNVCDKGRNSECVRKYKKNGIQIMETFAFDMRMLAVMVCFA